MGCKSWAEVWAGRCMNLERRDTMALQRQGSGTWTVGVPVSSTGDHKVLGIQRPSPGHSRMYDGGRSEQGGLRGSNPKNPSRLSKGRRALHTWRFPPCSVACVLVVCLLGLVALVLSGQFLMGGRSFPQQDDVFGKSVLMTTCLPQCFLFHPPLRCSGM